MGMVRSDLDYQLNQAVIWGRMDEVRQLLPVGANPNARDSEGDTILHTAARHNKADIAKLLIKAGATVDAKNKYGATPLHGAAGSGHAQVVRCLLEAGASVAAKTVKHHALPIHNAASGGSAEVVELLIAAGSDVNAVEKDALACTPLHEAASRGHSGVCRALIAAGADLDAMESTGDTPMIWAAATGNILIYRMLEEAGAQKHLVNRHSESVLHKALLKGHSELAMVLIEVGLSTIAPDVDYRTPLHLAAQNCAPEVVKRLLDKGANVHAWTTHYQPFTPLYGAAIANRAENCRLLVAAGASPSALPDFTIKDFLTPFQAAVKACSVDVVRYFVLECGEDLAQRTVGGKTLLQLAAKEPAMRDLLRSLKTELAVLDTMADQTAEPSVPAKVRSVAAL